MINLIHGDCLEELRKLPNESIDLVVTDPAYESMMRWAGVGTTARMGMGKTGSGSDDLENKWFEVFPNENLPELIYEIHRVLKQNRIAYIMCDWETLKLLHALAITSGTFTSKKYGGKFEPCKPLIVKWEEEKDYDKLKNITKKWLINKNNIKITNENAPDLAEDFLSTIGSAIDEDNGIPIIWDKLIQGTGYTYRPRYEFIFMLWKGEKRKLKNLSTPDVLTFKKPWGKNRIFPTQKPVELFEELIKQSSEVGEVVLDMFLGSGTCAKACMNTNRSFIGIEKSEKAINIAREQIKT